MAEQHILGERLPGWEAAVMPQRETLEGRVARLEPLSADAHAARLFDAYKGHDALWDYMGYGPFGTPQAYYLWAKEHEAVDDLRLHALIDKDRGICGSVMGFLRMEPAKGSIEIGHICHSPPLQHSLAATEAIWLMLDWVFKSGYRRCEWKCDALNLGSRRAAQRLGFNFEGIFRQHLVIKGRNRDTSWFAIIDKEWPALSDALRQWLSPDNFDGSGQQKRRLSDMTAPLRVASDPALDV